MKTSLRRSGIARVLKESHSFTCTPRVYLLTERTISVFAFPAEAGTHLPTPEGWKAELALGTDSFLEKKQENTWKCPAERHYSFGLELICPVLSFLQLHWSLFLFGLCSLRPKMYKLKGMLR